MTEPPKNAAQHWDAYWGGRDAAQGRQQDAAVTGDAPGDKFDTLWRVFFDTALKTRAQFRLADLACGAGVVTARAAEIGGAQGRTGFLCGVDYAPQAAAAVARRPAPPALAISGIAASVSALPFPDRCFDLIVSQFGVEYAGADALGEAARILAPGGAGQFVIHYKDGGIDRECQDNFIVLDAIMESGLFETARAAFGPAAAKISGRSLAEILEKLKPLLQGEQRGAKTLLARLMGDVSRLVGRRGAFHPQEALAWLLAMQREVELYRARMGAMNKAALSADDLEQVAPLIIAQGVSLSDPEPLMIDGKPLPAAWLLKLRREA